MTGRRHKTRQTNLIVLSGCGSGALVERHRCVLTVKMVFEVMGCQNPKTDYLGSLMVSGERVLSQHVGYGLDGLVES